jgi:hypothetical protein
MIQQDDRRGKSSPVRPATMGIRRRFAFTIACFAIALGCATPRPERPALLVDTNPFVSRLDAAEGDTPPTSSVDPRPVATAARAASRFCVTTLPDSIGLGKDDSRIEDFQSLLVEELETDGFEVVDPESVEATLKGALETSEPIYDPHTGRRSEARAKAARKDRWKALALEHDCEFFLSPYVARVSTSWIDGWAR